MKIPILALCLAFFCTASYATERKVYIVHKGDTLGEIMFTLKTQGVDIRKLHDWNPDLGTQVTIGEEISYFIPDTPPPPASRDEVENAVNRAIGEIGKLSERNEVSSASLRRTLIRLSGGALIIIFGTTVALWIRKGRNAQAVVVKILPEERQTMADVMVLNGEKTIEVLREPLMNPKPMDIRRVHAEILRIEGVSRRIKIRVSIKRYPEPIPGEAEVPSEGELLVYYGSAGPFSWEKRKEAAEKILGDLALSETPDAKKVGVEQFLQ